MIAVHERLGVALLVVFALGGAWALVSGLRGSASPTLRAFTRLAAAVTGVQVLIGLVLLAMGHRPADSLHYVYGGVLTLAVPAGVAMGADGDARREAWGLFGGLLAAVLIAVRAIATGG